MPNFEKLLMAVTRKGQLQPAHFRAWADRYEQYLDYSGANLVVWLRSVADTLEEIYTEITEKYKEDDHGTTPG